MDFFARIIEMTNAKPSSDGFMGKCPTHEDRNASLFIKNGPEVPFLYCHAQCDFREIQNYFKSQGAWLTRNDMTEPLNDYVTKAIQESSPLTVDSIAIDYLKNRGLQVEGEILRELSSLRFHPKLYHKNEDGFVSNYPAIIGKIFKGNSIIGLQRIYINADRTKLGSPKVLGDMKCGHIPFGPKPMDTLHLAEGIETALAVFLKTNEPTWSTISAGNLSKVTPPKTVKTIHVWADKDKSETGITEAEKAASVFREKGIDCFIHLPDAEIPHGEKTIDFLDIYNSSPSEINRKLNGTKICPIQSPSYLLPQITEGHLPYILRDWIFGHAERLNIQPEFIITPFLSIAGSIIGRKLVVKLKRQDDWVEHANLWGLMIAPPGTKKSPAFNVTAKHLSKIEMQEKESAFHINKQIEPELIVLRSDIKALKDKLKKDKNLSPEEKMAIAKQLSEKSDTLETKTAKPRKFFTNSCTIEKLIDLIVENPFGLLVYRDELNAILNSFNKKGHETDRQFFLEGWNGNGSFSYDTISRGSKFAEGVCVTLLGGIQPSIIHQITKDVNSGVSNDGFLQRFQLMVFPNRTITPKFVDQGVSKTTEDKVADLLMKLAKLDSLRHGYQEREDQIPFVRLEAEAYEMFAEYMNLLEQEIASLEDSPFKSHISKFGKLIGGLILIFHVIDNIETGLANHHAKAHVVEIALKWADLFKAHARKVYDVDHSFESLSGFALAKKIAEGRVRDGSSLRSIYINEWANLRDYSEVERGARFLEKHNWLKIREQKPVTGRSSLILSFRPGLNDFLNEGNWHHDQ